MGWYEKAGGKIASVALAVLIAAAVPMGDAAHAVEETPLKSTSRFFTDVGTFRTEEAGDDQPETEGKGTYCSVGLLGRVPLGRSVTGDIAGRTVTPFFQIEGGVMGFARNDGVSHSSFGGRVSGDLGIAVRALGAVAVEPYAGAGYELLKWYRGAETWLENLHGRVGVRFAVMVRPGVSVFGEAGIKAPNYRTIKVRGAPVFRPKGSVSDYEKVGIDVSGFRLYYFHESYLFQRLAGHIFSTSEVSGIGIGFGY